LKKFKETGSVADKPRWGRSWVSEDARQVIMANIYASPKELIKCKTTELGVPKSIEHDVSPNAKFHPYELHLLRHLSDDDTDRHVEMFE
jgi:cytochrome b involved in lipid metabolism